MKTSSTLHLNILCCPNCQSGLEISKVKKEIRCISCKKVYPIIDNTIPNLLVKSSEDTALSMKKWDKLYSTKRYVDKLGDKYKDYMLENTKRQVLKSANNTKKGIYCEIGVGSGYLGENLAEDGWFFVGIDFSLNALKLLKKRLDKKGINNYQLILGDIQNMPIKKGTVDLIFGGGVLEHFKNTQVVVDHLYRILKRGGVAFNTVPYMNIGNIIYRSQWGGIPNMTPFKQLAEFIHLKILKGKHMVFGYELQFTATQLKNIHSKAGFSRDKIAVERYEVKAELNIIKNGKLKKLIRYLCNNYRQFWLAVKVIARK